jgi:carbon-monoxide dehydrogenase medium subunit
MIPALQLLRPGTIGEAEALLAREVDARMLAGGQSLIPAMKTGLSTPTHLIDLRGLSAACPEIDTIRAEGQALWIGALVTHHRIATSPAVEQGLPMLAQLSAGIADQQIRNRGTIGGSVGLHDPSACWPAGVLASGATVVTQRHAIPADEFFTGIYGTSLASDEIILGLRFPGGLRGVYHKSEQKASRFALVGVAVTVAQSGTRIAITGLGHGVRRWIEAEALLNADFSPETLLGIELPESAASSDLHATARYRTHLARVLAVRAVATLSGRSPPPAPPLDSIRSRSRP